MQGRAPRSIVTEANQPTLDSSQLPQSDRLHASSFDRAKKSFLAAMSHELRTPLNAIIGFSEIMDSEIFGPIPIPQYRDYIRDILASGRHLLKIIEDVLEISRAEAGDLVLNKSEVDLRKLVTSAYGAFDGQCRSKNIKIVTDLPDDVIIQVDSGKVRRVIEILLSNAVKFSAPDSEINITAYLDDHSPVTISIRDEGIGIEPSAIERAFIPFVQLDDRLSRQYEGSGLGLPLARLLTELHGGGIELESMPGVGTTAIVQLPAYARMASTRSARIKP